MNMRIGRKSTTERLLDTIDHSLQVANDVRPALSHLSSVTPRKSTSRRLVDTVTGSLSAPKVKRLGSGKGKARKTGLIAAGTVAGLTAGSAGISSLRRRGRGTNEDS
jgi:hypothetical protein